MTAVVVGVDPGGRFTGVVTRHGDDLLAHTLLVRGQKDGLHTWVREVVGNVRWHVDQTIEHGAAYVVACESLNDPTPQMGTMAVRGLLDTAAVIGGLLAVFNGVVLVPPGGNGSGPRQAYPPALWGRELKGTGAKRHLRSAWDVAGAAVMVARLAVGRDV